MSPGLLLRRAGRAYLDGLNRYADFDGTADWAAFLGFFAVNLTVGLVLALVVKLTGNGFFELLATLYGLGVLLPGLAVTVRKLHAAGLSGWWLGGLIVACGVTLALL